MSSASGLPAVKPGRAIEGISAVYLPFRASKGDVDWDGFDRILEKTVDAGLVPAVNMDTGSTQFIDAQTRRGVLDRTRARGVRFIAGCFVEDREGDAFDDDAYRRTIADVLAANGTPIVFPSWGMAALADDDIVPALDRITTEADEFLAFELGEMFVPFGRVFPTAVFRQLLELPRCAGAKHSSLSRELEWERLRLRDETRPDFKVYTGNDLAIDMVMYGSDYLLGLSAFAPAEFARRDALWAAEDPRFFELNDALQALGAFAFRAPVPGYKHNCAQFLALRDVLERDTCPPGTPARPDGDREVLGTFLDRLKVLARD